MNWFKHLSFDARKCFVMMSGAIFCSIMGYGGIYYGVKIGKGEMDLLGNSVDHSTQTADLAGSKALESAVMFGVGFAAIVVACIFVAEFIKALQAVVGSLNDQRIDEFIRTDR